MRFCILELNEAALPMAHGLSNSLANYSCFSETQPPHLGGFLSRAAIYSSCLMLAVDQALQHSFPSTFIARSAKAIQSMADNILDQAVKESARSSRSDLGIQVNGGFSNVVSGTQIINSGPVYLHRDTESTLFGSLVAHDQHQDSIQLTRTILSKKARLQTGRRVSSAETSTEWPVL